MSFKVYLDLGGGRQEVRRFALPETVATNYSVLREKVCSIFGLANQDAVLSWKDSEGDAIVISTDDELMEAVADSLSNQNAQLVRINVAESSGRPEPGTGGRPGNQVGDIHLGVTCDGCSGVVQGFRYRCVACPDYDLCGACETKGMHKEHKMIRLPKPQDPGAPKFFWKEREEGPGQYSTHFGMQGGDAGGGTFQSSSFSGCGAAGPGTGGGAWFGFGGPRGRCHRRGHGGGGRGRGAWPGWWGRGWSGKNWAGCGQGQTMGSDSGCQQQQQQQSSSEQPQQQQSQQSQQQQSQQQQSNDKSPKDESGCPWLNAEGSACPFMGEDTGVPTPEQVQQMAQQAAHQAAQQAHHFATHYASDHLANVMRGIWTAWSGQQGPNATTSTSSSSSSSSSSSHSASASQDGPKQGTAEEQKSEQGGQFVREEYLRNVGETVANMLDPLGIDVEVAVEHNGIRQRCSLGENAPTSQSNTSPTPTSPTKQPESTPSSLASGSVNMEVQTEEPAEPQTPSTKDVEAMDVASPAPAPVSQVAGGQAEGHTGSPEPEDWMLVNQETSEPASASGVRPKTPPNDKPVSYPSLKELTPHPDPKIQQSLEQMSAMGYSNEGGWLTNLLEMKQGDINQVLDLLQPVNK